VYEAFEAIAKSGVIQPLEPVSLREDERLIVLRLNKHEPDRAPAAHEGGDWRRWVGVLKGSPHLNGDPLALQQALRQEWD
jgi:hypothetical protein